MKGTAAMVAKNTTTEQAAELTGPRSFSVLLAGLGEGTLHAELSETLYDLTKKLQQHAEDMAKAKGSLTLTLSIEVDREGLVTIDPDVKTKEPKALRRRGRYWLDHKNNLVSENPRQQKLPLREVGGVPPAAKEAPVVESPARGV